MDAFRKLNMQKICRKYDLEKNRNDIESGEISDWMAISISERIEYGYSLWADYCFMHGIDINKARLSPYFKIIKLK